MLDLVLRFYGTTGTNGGRTSGFVCETLLTLMMLAYWFALEQFEMTGKIFGTRSWKTPRINRAPTHIVGTSTTCRGEIGPAESSSGTRIWPGTLPG